MKNLNYLIAFGILAVIALTGCVPPTTITKNKVTISVTQPIVTEWDYAISTTGASNISKVVFTHTVSGCSVKSMPLAWKSGKVNGGIQVENSAGSANFNIIIECDAVNGPNYVDVHTLGGAATTLGPISGPT